jgi:hypothetical protein
LIFFGNTRDQFLLFVTLLIGVVVGLNAPVTGITSRRHGAPPAGYIC